MKIAVQCVSPLLQKSLELFLVDYISSPKQCDIIVRDKVCLNERRCFYIATDEDADLLKPFSKTQLLLALEKKYKTLYQQSESISIEKKLDFTILEQRIAQLTQEYQANILRAVEAFYEK